MPADPKAREAIEQLEGKINALTARVDDALKGAQARGELLQQLRDELAALKADSGGTDEPPPPATDVVKVATADDLQRALNAITKPITIRARPGVYTGNFVLPKHAADGWVTITPDTDSLQLRGKPWITPDFSDALIRMQSPNRGPALAAADGAARYVLTGIEGLPNIGAPDVDLFVFGRSDATKLEQLPADIVLDRVYIHGHPEIGQHRGVAFHVRGGTIRNAYFADIFEPGRDSQAIAAWNGPGPFLIENSFIEAGSENVLFGGSDATIPDVIASQITMRGCYLRTNPAWRNLPRQVKNLFELKAAVDVLIEACVFDLCWAQAGNGDAVWFSVRNQDGRNPWNTVANVLMRYCLLRGIEGAGVQVLGIDDHICDSGPYVGRVPPTIHGTNLTIEHCLLLNVQNGFKLNKTFHPTTIRHCTQPTVQHWALQFTGPPQPDSFVYEHNVTASGEYGITGDGTPTGGGTLDAHVPGWKFRNNVIDPAPYCRYPADNTILPAGTLPQQLGMHSEYTGPVRDDAGQPVGCDVAGLMEKIPFVSWQTRKAV